MFEFTTFFENPTTVPVVGVVAVVVVDAPGVTVDTVSVKVDAADVLGPAVTVVGVVAVEVVDAPEGTVDTVPVTVDAAEVLGPEVTVELNQILNMR